MKKEFISRFLLGMIIYALILAKTWTLSFVTPSSFSLSLFSISLSFIFMVMDAVALVSRWQLSGFSFFWLLENQSKSFNDVISRESKISSSLLPDTNGVLSSAWLAKSILLTMKNRSHIKILNRRGLKIDPWGIPNKISSNEL